MPKKPDAPAIVALDNQVSLVTLVKNVPVSNNRGMEELSDRFRLGMTASSHGEPVSSIELSATGIKVTIGLTQVLFVPMSNVASYRMVA